MVWTSLHARLHGTLRQRRLLKKTQPLLVAVSGGQDSLCLLKLLLDLQSKWEWQLAVAHCDHGWSSDEGIADRVREIARHWDLPFYLKATHQLKETEADAREWRYRSLLEIATERGFECILTGHTQSDRAETLLYNLIRGSGIDGLSALTWQRSLTSQVQLVRPLLNISRAETLAFCQEFRLPVWEDAANQKLHYVRNRIRTYVLPYIKEQFNPQVEQALAQTAELLRADAEYLENSAREILEKAISSDRLTLDRLFLRKFPLALQRRVMRQFLKQSLKKSPDFRQIEALTHLIDAPNRTRTSTLERGLFAEAVGDSIILKSQINS